MKVFPGRILESGFDPCNTIWYKKATESDDIILINYNDEIGNLAKAYRFKGQLKFVAGFYVKINSSIFEQEGLLACFSIY